MPSTLPGISVTEAQQLMQVQDRIIKQFPEVETVLGKAGRAETSTDPAPLSMMETVIVLKPQTEWRKVDTWYSSWAPEWAQRDLPPLHAGPHLDRPAGRRDERGAEDCRASRTPGPCRSRPHRHADHRRPHAGGHQDLRRRHQEDRAARHPDRERCCRRSQGTRSVFAERTGGGYFLDFDWNRDAAGALRPDHRRRAGRRDERHRRRERHHHGGRPRALSGERPLHARFPQRSSTSWAACWCRSMDGPGADSAVATGRHPSCAQGPACCATRTAC